LSASHNIAADTEFDMVNSMALFDQVWWTEVVSSVRRWGRAVDADVAPPHAASATRRDLQ